MAASPSSTDGLAAQAELEAYQSEAEEKLIEVQDLIAARDWEQATTRLSDLKRDYANMSSSRRW